MAQTYTRHCSNLAESLSLRKTESRRVVLLRFVAIAIDGALNGRQSHT
jgi:hypothetical protein